MSIGFDSTILRFLCSIFLIPSNWTLLTIYFYSNSLRRLEDFLTVSAITVMLIFVREILICASQFP